jgi:radical SAM-linked protein
MNPQTLKAIFSKRGEMRFISHLDLMRLFQRALRRAGLPAEITRGFNPHLKVSIPKALKLGVEGQNEEAIIHMEKAVEPEFFMESMNANLPEGIRVKKVEVLK